MKKNLLLTICLFILATTAVIGQGYRQMNGYYQWNGNQRFLDSLFLDTNDYDVSAGFNLIIDTTGGSTTGFYHVKTGQSTSGTVKGVGAPFRLAYWATTDSLTKTGDPIPSDGILYSADSAYLSFSPAGQKILACSTNNKNIFLTGSKIWGRGNGLEIEPKSGAAVWISAASDTAFYATSSGAGSVGIRTNNPATPLHVKGSSEVLLTLDGNSVGTPNVEIATLENFPIGVNGDPSIFVLISVNGQNYYMPLWSAP